jgi:outer membrane protein assembly factor BamB
MHRTAILGAVLLACVMVPAARAADAAVLPGESRTTAARLAEVRKKVNDKKYAEAIDELQAILDGAGNDLIPLSSQHLVQARRLCHREIAKLPPEALSEYRSRVNAQAKKWLDEAAPARDVRLLRRIVDEAFCSRAGEAAVDLLGDLAFERGRFDEALAWWRLLAPPLAAKKENRDELELAYPDPQGDKARLYAKQIVARYFAGDGDAAARELEAFRKEYRKAEGSFLGRTGKYADLLQDLLKQPPPESDRAWTTFGGDATRGLVVPGPPGAVDRLNRTVKDGPTWQFDLETRRRVDGPPPAPGNGKPDAVRARSLASHPLICGRYAVVADARYVTAYDLRTGKKEDWYDVADPKNGNALAAPNLKLPAPPDLRYTMTAADGGLYVRLGAQNIVRPDDKEADRDGKIASFLACLSVEPDAEGKRDRWCMRPEVVPGKPVVDQRGAIFEGAPVAHNDRLYVAVTWFDGDRTLTAVQCFPAGTRERPPLRWQQTVCETRELRPREQRPRHHLLTVAGPNVVYCSHSGAVVAVDAQTGKTVWAVRYTSKAPNGADEPSLRDLTPCLYAAGRLYVAPADDDRLLCLDPLTGETLWERERTYPTHLLGVGKGHLIFTTLTELRAVSAADGGDSWRLPDGGGKLAPMGRGFLLGDVVVWPTANGVFVRQQEDGDPVYSPVILDRVPAGNLVYSDGVLATADRTTLSVFVPPAMQLEQRREQTKKNPDSLADLLLLTRAEADAGPQAGDRRRVVEAVWRLFDAMSGNLPPSVKNECFRVMSDTTLELALRQAEEEQDEDALRLCVLFLTNTQRDEVTIHRAKVCEAKGERNAAIRQWQSLLEEHELRSAPLIDDDGVPRRPRFIAQRNLTRLGVALDEPRPFAFVPRTALAPDQTQNWSLPWERSGERKLTLGDRLLPVPGLDDGLLVTNEKGLVTFHPHDTARKGWDYPLNFWPTTGWIDGERAIFAGDGGLTAINTRQRERLWSIHQSGCSAFQFAGGRIFFLENGERLFAVDAATGDTVWAKWAPGAQLGLPPPLGRFHPQITPLANGLLVQPTPGRLWLLDAATGKPLHEGSNRHEPWPRAPVALDDNTAVVVLDARTVGLYDGAKGKFLWKHVEDSPTTLTGEAPQVVVARGNILLVTANNIGYRLQRLDRLNGKPLWEKPPMLDAKSKPDAAGWSLDRDAVYYPQDGVLTARALVDGKVVWRQALPAWDGGWRTLRTGDAVLAYPNEVGAGRIQFRRLGVSVQWEWDHSPAVGDGPGFPVLCCEAKSGRLAQRLNLVAGPPRVRTRLGLLPRVAAQPYLGTAPPAAPRVVISRAGVLIALDSHVWSYTPSQNRDR